MAQPAWMDRAWAELGQREVAGHTDNPRIMSFCRELGYADVAHDEIAWCAAFVGASLERAGVASTRSLVARSYLSWGDEAETGRLGAVAIFSRGGDESSGHVAFYLDDDGTRVFVLGGNQGDAVTVTAIDRERLIGLRWPSTELAQPDNSTQVEPVASVFETALAHVLQMEGGWTEDPYDPGGPTNFGITLATLAAHRNVRVEAASFAELKQSLRQIPAAQVRQIYLERYWRPAKADALAPAIALMHFDAAVNHGAGTAARILQEAAGVTIDGEIGPETIGACSVMPAAQILERYAAIRRARYRALGHFWRFGRGWLARVDRTLGVAGTLSTLPPALSQLNGDRPMTDIKTISPAPAAKWWGQSITMWGTIITTAATVIPVLGPLIGLDITGEMIRQLGAQSVQAVQAIGGLVGTVMAVYGRARASTRLELRAVTRQV